DYFKTLRIPFVRGRSFTDQEIRERAKVLIVSESLARQTFPNEDPIGKRLIVAMGNQAFEIIGIVGDIRHRALESQPAPAMYMPAFQPGENVVIRTQGDPAGITAAVRKEVQAIDPYQPIATVRTMEEWLGRSVAAARYRTMLVSLFAALALVLSAVGIYGVMSYTVGQRTQEIGVRMALGARQLDVLKLVVRQGMVLVLTGIAVGVVGAIALTRIIQSLLFEVGTKAPTTFAAGALLLIFVAFVACYIPARRATKVDPLEALRYE
ncbi:MAG: FtsX-like permease family protein, partial [Pyrinomonadaceae bacterium]